VQFVDYNVAADPEARERLKRLTGRLTIPVIKVDEETIIGFDREKLEQLLNQ